jgi:hypothetical protein
MRLHWLAATADMGVLVLLPASAKSAEIKLLCALT